LELLSDVDAVICNKTVIGKKEIENAPKLKYIGLFATGYNNIDTAFARERGITVCNAGTYSSNAVCQQVFAFILDRCAKVSEYDNFVKEGGWITHKTFSAFVRPTNEIAGKTLGIIGYGAIGKTVANVALAFGMNVIVYTRTPKDDPRVKFVDFDTLLKESDFVSVHCPLTDKTAGMFNYEAFKKMKKSAMLINTGRGGMVVEADLRRALDEGVIACAAVDVLCTEPMAEDCPLLGAPNCIITPHIAWAGVETRRRLMGIVAENIRRWQMGNPINRV